MNEVVRSSKERFTVGERKDASDFLRWLVNALRLGLRDKTHSTLAGVSPTETTVIAFCFRGRIETTAKKFTLVGVSSVCEAGAGDEASARGRSRRRQ